MTSERDTWSFNHPRCRLVTITAAIATALLLPLTIYVYATSGDPVILIGGIILIAMSLATAAVGARHWKRKENDLS